MPGICKLWMSPKILDAMAWGPSFCAARLEASGKTVVDGDRMFLERANVICSMDLRDPIRKAVGSLLDGMDIRTEYEDMGSWSRGRLLAMTERLLAPPWDPDALDAATLAACLWTQERFETEKNRPRTMFHAVGVWSLAKSLLESQSRDHTRKHMANAAEKLEEAAMAEIPF